MFINYYYDVKWDSGEIKEELSIESINNTII